MNYNLNLNSWIYANHDRIQSINIYKSIILFFHRYLFNNKSNIISTIQKSIIIFFTHWKNLIFLIKIGRISLSSSINLDSWLSKNNYILIYEYIIIRIFIYFLWNIFPKISKSLRYAISLKSIILIIAISINSWIIVIYATIVIISIATIILDHI